MRKAPGVATILFVASISFPGAHAVAGGDPTSATESVFVAKCASCHGKDGSGSTTMGKKLALRDLRSPEVQKQTDQQLFDITAKGKKKMPAYEKKMSAQQIHDLVAYIRTLATN